MSFTNYLEERILNHFFRATAQTGPTGHWVGLASAATSEETPTLTELTSGTAPGYARVSITFAAPTQGADFAEILNSALVSFPANSGGSDWPTVTHFLIADAVSAGNILAVEQLNAPRTVQPGDIAEFAAGSLAVRQS